MSTARYQISGPALHATRTILRNWVPREKKFEATARNIAIMIDVATQIFKLQQQLQQLLSVAPRGKSKIPDLAKNIEEVRHVIRLVEMTHQQMQAGPVERTPYALEREGAWRNWQISEQAKRAARHLFVNYDWERSAIGKMQPTEHNFAQVIDTCIDAWRANISLPLLIQESGWQTSDFSDNFLALRRALADMELLNRRAPKIAPGIVTVQPPKGDIAAAVADYKPVAQEPTAEQRARMKPVAEALSRARTVDEELAVMKRAGFVRAQ